MSAYSDIEFIKMALKVDATDYILKPVNLDELTNVIKRVIKELDEEKERMDYMLAVEKRLKQSISHLNKDFFVNLIEGSYKSVEEIKQKMEFLGLNLLEKTSFFVVSVRFEEYGAIISDMSQQAKKAFDFAVLNVLQEMIDGFANGYSFDIGEGDFVGIINVFENCTQNEIKSFRNELEIIIKKTFNTNVSIENGILVECIE